MVLLAALLFAGCADRSTSSASVNDETATTSGKRFVLRKRKIFKTSDEGVMKYAPKIEISDE
jgi:hypothetical protein